MLLKRTGFPGIYRRGSRHVVVYRIAGRQRKKTVATLAEARAFKLARAAEAEASRAGPTLHAYALNWVERYGGSGRDSVRDPPGVPEAAGDVRSRLLRFGLARPRA